MSANRDYEELDQLIEEALASRRPDPPDSGEIEIYDVTTGWIRPEELPEEEPGGDDSNANTPGR